MKPKSVRDELRSLYRESRLAYEQGFVAGHRGGSHRGIFVRDGDATWPAYRAGHSAAREGRSSAMPDDVFVDVLVEWCK